MNMKEQLISFEVAKLAKEKGFNIACYSWYNDTTTDNKQLRTGSLHNHNHPMDTVTMSAPTQALLQKWIREVHKIYVTSIPSYGDDSDNKRCFFEIAYGKKVSQLGHRFSYFNTYEEALEVGLEEALILINV